MLENRNNLVFPIIMLSMNLLSVQKFNYKTVCDELKTNNSHQTFAQTE